MKSFFQVAAFAAAASAAVLRRDQCCFQITATGGVSGVMGQLSDGQNRINGSYSPATYCYSNGGIIDSAGRGCVVTYTNDATHQFQCDLNSPPTYGFSIASNGSILYLGSDQFYACPATDTEYNVYTTWLKGQDKCKPVTLSTNATCAASSPSGGVSVASSSATGYSIPAYTSPVESTTPVAYTSPVQVTTAVYSTSASVYSAESSQTVPGYSAPSSSESAPAYISTVVASQSVPAYSSAPGYSAPSSQESASAYTSTVVASQSVPAYSSSAPGYTASSIPVESSPVASVPVESTYAQSTTQVISSYPAESSTTPVPESYDTTVTAETTYYTTECSESETQTPSESTPVSVYSTWSTSTAVASSSTPVESIATIPGYSAPSSVVSTTSVIASTPSSTAVYSSVETSVSSIISVPGYGSTTAQSSTTPVAVSSETQASIPGYGTSASIASSSSSAASTPAVSSSISSSTTPSTSTTASTCQTSLSGAYQTPHLIIPISSTQPSTAYGTQYNATINSTTSTIFNFDIPSSYSGMTCSIIFLFPLQADLETSAYTFSGSGSLVFAELSGVATEATTYDNAPSVEETLDTIAIESGNSYVVATGSCAAGTTESIEISSSGGLSLEFFEDWNPSSLGLYITAC